MAIKQQVVVNMADDLTGEQIPEGGGRTVRFGIGTPDKFVTYDLELTTANEQELEDFLSRYKAAARIVKPEASKRSGRASGTADSDIRKWARSAGLEVPARGKISDEIRAAYKARSKTKTQPAGAQTGEG
ncbi:MULTISPECIES: histone-like nucleoid-structuring protein Lsr2 [Nocardia]|uniref:histone-like nucleoid-structuring protein Lsr2 n=1 Tax=Nocardia TaxID=1817 RepID=UPI002458CF47|nr:MULTISPECIES: Lsr2 family protein [Nocardia]